MNCFKAQVLIMVFSISFDLVFSQTNSTSFNKCVLDFNISSSSSSSRESCTTLDNNWDGFLTHPCCGSPFNRYLRALARWTNQTRLIFLNSTQQMDCLTLMNHNSTDIFSCGIEKLTSGAGGCSDYSEIDVLNELGSRLNSLRDDCRLMDSGGGLTKGCNKCLKTWREITYTSKNDSMKLEDDICRFSMLIFLTSERVADVSWIDKIFHCLGDNSLPLGKFTSIPVINIFKFFSSKFWSLTMILIDHYTVQNRLQMRVEMKRYVVLSLKLVSLEIHIHKNYWYCWVSGQKSVYC